MAAQLEESLACEAWTPKTLVKQAAQTVARNLVVAGIPIIQSLLCKKTTQTSETDNKTPEDKTDVASSRISPSTRLRRLRDWYWSGTAKFIGDSDSKLRCAITKSLLDVIDMVGTFGQTDLLHKFAFQLLFSREAGNLGRIYPCRIVAPNDESFSKFLLSTSPFHIRELHDETLKFPGHFQINFIILNSSDLRRIRLFRNINEESLDRMRIHSKKTEIIILEFNSDTNYDRIVEDDSLFKMFFENTEKNKVLQLLVSNKPVPISFPKLKEVRLRCERVVLDIAPFIQCLLYTYKTVKVTVTWLVSVPHDEFLAKYPFMCPSFQATGSVSEQEQTTYVYMYNEDFEMDVSTGVSQKNFIEPSSLHKVFQLFASSVYYMQNVLAMITLSNLKYIFSDVEKIRVNSLLVHFTERLRRLYVYGPFQDNVDEENLVESLNRCPNLEALSFTIKPIASPVLQGLYPLINLKVLSLEFSAMVDPGYPYCRDTPMKEEAKGKFMELLIKAAPNLEILEVPCIEYLIPITAKGYLQKLLTFSVTKGELEVIYDCIVNLSSLKHLLLDKYFKYNAYLALKKFFFYSNLQISYKRGRHVVPYTS